MKSISHIQTSSMRPTSLLFGATSILGFHLARQYSTSLLPFASPTHASSGVQGWQELNLESSNWISEILKKYNPATLLYCHAICDVPKCEVDPDWAYDINVGHLKRVLAALSDHTRLVYVSSDHVFGGDGLYHEDSSPSPITAYGRMRVEAEDLVLTRKGSLIIRPGLAIGPSPNGRNGYLDWLRYRTLSNLPITIIEDEYRSAVWAKDLADRVMQLVESPVDGIRHVPATRVVSRVELASYLFSKMELPPKFFSRRRHQQPIPHLGRVELGTRYSDELSSPLSSVLDQSTVVPS